MINRSQLCSHTTQPFLSIDYFNTPTCTSLQRRGAIMVSPCLSVSRYFVSCSNPKSIRCRTKKRNSSVAHQRRGSLLVFRLIVQRFLLLFSYLIIPMEHYTLVALDSRCPQGQMSLHSHASMAYSTFSTLIAVMV